MSITLSALQKQRRDSAANWTAENPTLLAGEIGIESDTGYWKVGDGSTAWTSLAYISGLGAEIPVSRLADGSARQLLQTAANGTDVEWTSNVDIPGTLDVTGAATFDAAVTIQGDLTVNGTTTTIDTQNLIVEDKNVIIGQVTTPTDVTADGGGITLKGTTDKTINWVDATDAWTSSERFSVPTGTAAAPTLTFTGDPNTGIYSPGADQLAISTNGTGRLFINSSGLVGVGNSSPGYPLDVAADGVNAVLRVRGGSGGLSLIQFTDSAVSAQWGVITTSSGSYNIEHGSVVRFSTASSERLRIDSSGRVGIGTSDPGTVNSNNGSGNLVVASSGSGGITVQCGATSTGRLTFAKGATGADSYAAQIALDAAAGSLGFATANSTRMTIDSSGRVGIGTTSPGAPLDVNGAIHSRSSGVYADAITAYSGSSLAINAGSSNLNITVNASERLRIDSSGRLLVGTSSTSANTLLLVVGGPGAANGSIRLATSSTTPASGATISNVSFANNAATHATVAEIACVRDGGTWTNGTSHPTRLEFSTTADGASSPTERMRITQAGFTKLSNAGTYYDSTGGYHEARTTANDASIIITATNATYTKEALRIFVTKSANTDWWFADYWSAATTDKEFGFRGDGQAYADGSWNGGGADYAEYFEWSDSNPNAEDRRGISVVLDGDKIREAQPGEDPIGVISGNPSVVGDAAWNKWSGKYLRDEFGTYIQEDYEVTDDDGNTVTQQRRKLNPAYDPDVEYVSREERPEWDCVGLMGKLRIRKGQATGSRWIKMRDISDSVEEWLVR